ncbi:general secretion pathway protein K [Pseudoduganella lurida]|uniref:Type II secretion system protein K n=1 Tax=Pseudoduganella lurida TaxID=1036180 RepID=A0A562R2P8_9BURK|nr:type II secretion system minor pseudopilin GspK [Pseudoduganella lurida]TWI63093.1 general secretion pathway protein K [Pseudoduganella lurida]
MRGRTQRTRRKQRGVAVVTALLLTALAITIVASLFWQQQVQVRSVENQRLHLQTRWILRGALDWARLILRQDGMDNPKFTRADGVWATPLAETRLDQYVERERVQGEDYDATLKGQIYDAQSRYNLANLATAAVVNSGELSVFRQLLNLLQLDSGLASAAAQLVARGQVQSGQQGTQQKGAMPLQRVEDLAAAGFSPAAIERLRDFVIVLPNTARVNVNTAKAEVLAALVQGMSLSEAQSLVAARKNKTYGQQSDFTGAMTGRTVLADVVTRSDYFLVLSQVKLDRAVLESWALIRRLPPQQGSRTFLEWIREI